MTENARDATLAANGGGGYTPASATCRIALAAIKWYFQFHFIEVVMMTNLRKPVVISGDNASGRDTQGSSLVPMLVAGLILVAVGAVVVMAFV